MWISFKSETIVKTVKQTNKERRNWQKQKKNKKQENNNKNTDSTNMQQFGKI